MCIQIAGASEPVHAPYQCAGSRLVFRGPERTFDKPYIAYLGGTETFGRFVPTPFPKLLEYRLGQPCINLGFVNVGVDAFLADEPVFYLATEAQVAVLQVLSAQNISNPYYTIRGETTDSWSRHRCCNRSIPRWITQISILTGIS